MDNILLTKISSNPTDTSYSIAYSTLNLYIVISIQDYSNTQEPIGSFGKKLLEKLQREYFAQDEKKLSTIKQAVQNSIDDLPTDLSYSLLLATVSSNILYIVIANAGVVVLKRKGALREIARGESLSVTSFSGKLEHGDLVIIESRDFSEKIPFENLSKYLQKTASETAEALLPIMHENANGGEAAIILEYLKNNQVPDNSQEEQIPKEEMIEDRAGTTSEDSKNSIPKRLLPQKISFQKITNLIKSIPKNKTALIIISIIILILVLTASLINENIKKENERQITKLQKLINPARKQYEEAEALKSLNKGIALENLTAAKNSLEEGKGQFKEGSTYQKEIDELLVAIDQQLQQLKGNTLLKGKKLIFDAKKVSFGKIIALTFKSKDLIVLEDKGKVAKIKNGRADLIINNLKNPKYLTADQDNIYTLVNEGILKISTETKKEQLIAKINTQEIIALDTFLDNIYLLNTKEKTIDKYSDPSFSKTSYIEGGSKLSKNPVSMTIDGSVWITTDDGEILKFKKGKQENFAIKNLPTKLSSKTTIYTQEDSEKLYVLDIDNQKIIVIDKSGNYINQYELGTVKVEHFAVDEKSNTVFVFENDKIYSFEI